MQPPPRKGNYAKFLKNLHSEQLAKLATKNQHECDLLEDIRTFTIKRCAIERSYSDALLKISSAYLNKKIPNIPDIKVDGGEEKWNMWNVWRTVLEENEKLARARLAAVEVFQQQIAEDAKMLRSHKVNCAKKCVDHLAVVQKEVQTCVQDVDKTKKLYFDEEHSAHDVRDKARDLEEKLKKKKGSFFQSITSLQKNSAKFSSKRDQLEEKSSGARNDYLLCLAAANAHQNRYFVVDLQLCMSTMESSVFDKVAEYLTLMGRTELLTCSAMQNSFSVIRDQAKQLSREYNLQCCYLYYPVLKQHIQYEYEPCDSDPILKITAEHESAAATLSKEARRWATRIARENNNIRDAVRRLQVYNALRESGQRVDPSDQNGPDLETKMEEMKQCIRRAETSKMKAEARIECLRQGGVNVDEWLQEAETLNVQDIQRSASSLSDHPSSDSFYDSDFADGDAPAVTAPVSASPAGGASSATTAPVEVKVEKDFDEDEDSQEVDAMLEQERHQIEQLTAEWDDPTQVDWGNEDTSSQVDGMERTTSAPGLKCTALYSYTAQNPDELSIVENEQLEVVGEGDGDGWLRARNYRGEEGYVPNNYLDVEREDEEQHGGGLNGTGATLGSSDSQGGLVQQISFSSVDYTVDNEDGLQHQYSENQSPDQVSVIAAPVVMEDTFVANFSTGMTATPPDTAPPSAVTPLNNISAAVQRSSEPAQYCVALYDYDGEGNEELSFEEGQVIRILSRIAHSIDDGWWQGDLNGRIGNFPSLVVEECNEYGEPLSARSDEEPPCSAPPVFTPPDVPEHLIDDEFDEGEPGQHNMYFDSYDDDIGGLVGPDGEDYEDSPEPPTTAPPPMPPPPAPPAPLETTAAVKPDPNKQPKSDKAGFNIELSRGQHDQYDQQFVEEKNKKNGVPIIPIIGIPSVIIDDENVIEDEDLEGEDDEFGLGVAQIVITAATPMIEEAEHPFPPPDPEPEGPLEHNSGGMGMMMDDELPPVIEEEEEEQPLEYDDEAERLKMSRTVSTDDIEEERQPADSAPFPISSSSEGETTGPSTAENSVSHAPPATSTSVTSSESAATVVNATQVGGRSPQPPSPPQQSVNNVGRVVADEDDFDDIEEPPKQVVGGRASIPDELEPHQLARLQDLKESNA